MYLISGETIVIDSFKIRAQNSLKNNFNQKKIDRHLEYIDDKINDFEKALDPEDLSQQKKEDIKKKKTIQEKRRKEYKAIEKELEESGASQICKTDPDARSVILHRNVVTENPEYYKLRQQITEHQFGTMKQQWDFTFTLMKGKENVLSEVILMMMVYNLR